MHQGPPDTKPAGQLTIGVEIRQWRRGSSRRIQQRAGLRVADGLRIAKKLGFSAARVWVSQVFRRCHFPVDKQWDLDINEFTITAERAQSVDFSEPYYVNDQAIVVMASNRRMEGLKATLNDAQKLRLGAQTDTTSFTTANALNPGSDTDVAVFDKHEDVLLALQDGKIDGMVTDAPTAQLIATQQVNGSKVFARLVPADPQSGGEVRRGAARQHADAVYLVGDPAVGADRTIEGLQDMWLGGLDAGETSCLGRRSERHGSSGAVHCGRHGAVGVAASPGLRHRRPCQRRRSWWPALGGGESPGWQRVQKTFLDPQAAWEVLPTVLDGLLLNCGCLSRSRDHAGDRPGWRCKDEHKSTVDVLPGFAHVTSRCTGACRSSSSCTHRFGLPGLA